MLQYIMKIKKIMYMKINNRFRRKHKMSFGLYSQNFGSGHNLVHQIIQDTQQQEYMLEMRIFEMKVNY